MAVHGEGACRVSVTRMCQQFIAKLLHELPVFVDGGQVQHNEGLLEGSVRGAQDDSACFLVGGASLGGVLK